MRKIFKFILVLVLLGLPGVLRAADAMKKEEITKINSAMKDQPFSSMEAPMYKLSYGGDYCKPFLENLNRVRKKPTELCQVQLDPTLEDFKKVEWEELDVPKHLPLLKEAMAGYFNTIKPKILFVNFWEDVDQAINDGYPVKLERSKIKIFPDGRVNTFIKLTFQDCGIGQEPKIFMLNADGTNTDPDAQRIKNLVPFAVGRGDLFYQKRPDYNNGVFSYKDQLILASLTDGEESSNLKYYTRSFIVTNYSACKDCPHLSLAGSLCAYTLMKSN